MQTKKGMMMTSVTLIKLSVNVMFWMKTFGTAHGNKVSPPWITLSGCFNYSSNNDTIYIQDNGPTQCFENCQGFQRVGLKNVSCICNPSFNTSSIRLNRLCNLKCKGKSEVSCGREDAVQELMSVYTRDTPLPDGINGSTSYGYVYVVVSRVSTYHASENNTWLKFGYFCYNDREFNCHYDKALSWTWEGAVKECNDRSTRIISDMDKCPPGGPFSGTYWIGIYRDKPDLYTTTISTTTKITTIQTTTAIRTTPFITPETSLEVTNVTVTSTEMKNEKTNQPTSDDKTVSVLVSVIIPVVLTALITFGVIVYKKKRMSVKPAKKRDENGVGANGENGEDGISTGPSYLEDEDDIKKECQIERPGSHTEYDSRNTNMTSEASHGERKARKEERRRKRDEKKRRKEEKHKDKMNKALINKVSDKGICPKRDIATTSGAMVQVSGTFDFPPREHADIKNHKGKHKREKKKNTKRSDVFETNASSDEGTCPKRDIATASGVRVQVRGKFDFPPGEHTDIGKREGKHKRKQGKNTKNGDGFETNYLNLENDVTAP